MYSYCCVFSFRREKKAIILVIAQGRSLRVIVVGAEVKTISTPVFFYLTAAQ